MYYSTDTAGEYSIIILTLKLDLNFLYVFQVAFSINSDLSLEIYTQRKLYSGRNDDTTYQDHKRTLKKTPSINTIGTDEFINDLA